MYLYLLSLYRTHGHHYCTIAELDEAVRAAQSKRHSSHQPQPTKEDSQDTTAVEEEGQVDQVELEKSYERTKSAIIYWASVGEVRMYEYDTFLLTASVPSGSYNICVYL